MSLITKPSPFSLKHAIPGISSSFRGYASTSMSDLPQINVNTLVVNSGATINQVTINQATISNATFTSVEIQDVNVDSLSATTGNFFNINASGTIVCNMLDVTGEIINGETIARSGTFLSLSATGCSFGDVTCDTITGTNVNVIGTTQSTSTTNGALVVSGGLGLAKDLRMGGSSRINMGAGLDNKKLALYDTSSSGDNHQFFGFGMGPATLRYSVQGTASNHIFYASINGTSSNELLSIKGNGQLIMSAGTTEAISTITGALVVPGGIGLAKNLWMGSGAHINMGSGLINKKIALYDNSGNDHQFFGFGVEPGALRYSVNGTDADHIFYSSTSPTSSNQLLSIKGNGQLNVPTTTDATSTTSGAITTAGGISCAKSAYIGTTLNVTDVKVNGTTQSTSFITGALVVSGGLGLAKDLRMDGSAHINMGTGTINKKLALYDGTGNDHQFMGFGIEPGNLRYSVNGTDANHVFYASASPTGSNHLLSIKGDGQILVPATTQSTSTTSGSLVVSGGLGLAKDLHMDSSAHINMGIGLTNKKLALYDNSGNNHEFFGFGTAPATLVYLVSGTGSNHTFYASVSSTSSNELLSIKGDGQLNVPTTTDATSTTSGAITTAGGISCAKNAYIGTTLNATNVNAIGTTQSTSTTTGSLVVSGGLGLAKDLRIGSSAHINMGNNVIHKKIALYDNTGNDYQFYGFGVSSNQMRYTTDLSASDHVFYCGSGTLTNTELARIKGSGQINVPTTTDATSTTSGAITTAGGISCAKNAYIGTQAVLAGSSNQILIQPGGAGNYVVLNTTNPVGANYTLTIPNLSSNSSFLLSNTTATQQNISNRLDSTVGANNAFMTINSGGQGYWLYANATTGLRRVRLPETGYESNNDFILQEGVQTLNNKTLTNATITGSTLSSANSTITNANITTLTGSTIYLTSGIQLPSSGGTSTLLDYYEEYTFVTNTVSNIYTASHTCQGRLIRYGKNITIHFLTTVSQTTATTTGGTLLHNETLPARFRPTVQVTNPWILIVANSWEDGGIQITTAGAIGWLRKGGASFPTSTASTGFFSGSTSYTLMA